MGRQIQYKKTFIRSALEAKPAIKKLELTFVMMMMIMMMMMMVPVIFIYL